MANVKKKKLEFVFEIADKKTGKVLYAFDMTFKVTPERERSPMFAASLVYMEKELLEKVITTNWKRKEEPPRAKRKSNS